MTRPRHLLLLGAMSTGLMMATILPAQATPSATGQAHSERAVCGTPAALHARCDAHVVTKADGVSPAATKTYTSGYAPTDLQSAYNLPVASTGAGAGQTIAIVDAYDNPSAYQDVIAYRAQFKLPVLDNPGGGGPTFTKLNQNGFASPLPAGDTGWGQEIALDLDMASAICGNCNILLVEAKSASYTDLGAAVNAAAASGATVISNSYGGPEFSSETSTLYESPYNHPNIPITVSSGDSGYGVQFPASSRYVTAVGGTSLSRSTTTRGWTETAWSGAGSGCSAYVPKPTWQLDSGCGRRTVADVSAVANPNTGVAVYDSYGSTGGANWLVFGGTSVAAPVIAGVYALAANGATVVQGSYPYANTSSLFDVTSGSNGRCSAGKRTTSSTYLCTAVTGYDGPTGLGTPNGTAGF